MDANPDDARGEELPVVDPPARAAVESTPDPSVAGLVLAAGTSSRFGASNKLLATVAGEPVVRRATRALADPIARVVVAVGHEADAVAAAVAPLPVDVVVAEGYERGRSAALATGLAALPDDVDAVVVGLGDTPAVDADSVRALVRAYRAGAGTALAAAHEGRRGNPVLFDARHVDALARLEGDRGGRRLLAGADAALVETGDPGVVADVDTPADLERIRRQCSE